jgi:hypothetical protein
VSEPVPPEITLPLLTLPRLAVWAEEYDGLERPEFAAQIIESVSVLLRTYGDPFWDVTTIPPRARDIGYIVAKDYYLNPRQLRQETTGPLQESLDNSVLNGINFTEEQKLELARLADDATGQVDGIWRFSTTRGPVETHRRGIRGEVLIWDTRGEWPISYLDPDEAWVFLPEEE